MRVHNKILSMKPELEDVIKSNAKKVGLDWPNFDKHYILKKLSAKTSSPLGYPDSYTVLSGHISLIGNVDFVSLYMESLLGWFRTSPVISCKKSDTGFEIETENSVYFLEED